MKDDRLANFANVERCLEADLVREMAAIKQAMLDYYGEEPPGLLDKRLRETRADIILDILHSVMKIRRFGFDDGDLASDVQSAWTVRVAFLEKQEIELHDVLRNAKGGMAALRRRLRRE